MGRRDRERERERGYPRTECMEGRRSTKLVMMYNPRGRWRDRTVTSWVLTHCRRIPRLVSIFYSVVQLWSHLFHSSVFNYVPSRASIQIKSVMASGLHCCENMCLMCCFIFHCKAFSVPEVFKKKFLRAAFKSWKGALWPRSLKCNFFLVKGTLLTRLLLILKQSEQNMMTLIISC